MKIARIAFNDIGLFKAIEIKNFSPGLNLIVGPTGSGKTTIRRAIGGIFYGFDETTRRRLLDDQDATATGELELQIGDNLFQLQRHNANWNATADVLRNVSSGISSQSLSRNLGDLNATDYFTFFNVSLIDSPDLERRMVRCLTERMGVVATGQAYWKSEADHLRWRQEAQNRRQSLETLEAQMRQLVSRRDRLQHELTAAERTYQQRVLELDRQIESSRLDVATLESRLRDAESHLRPLDIEVESVRREIERLRSEVTYQEAPVAKPDRLSQRYAQLDKIERQIKRTRSVQRDVYNRRSEIRDQRIRLSEHEAKARNTSAIRARLHVNSLEQRMEHLSHVLNEAVKFDRDQYRTIIDREFQSLDSEIAEHIRGLTPAQQVEQAKEDIYALCQDLSQYHLQTARVRLSAEARDLRRCAAEMKQRMVWLKMRRNHLLSDIKEVDPAGYELVIRGEKSFCECARHTGYLEARRKFLGQELIPPKPAVKHVDTSALERQLHDLLADHSATTALIHSLQLDLDHKQTELERLLAQRTQFLGGLNVDHLKRELKDVHYEIQDLEGRLVALRSEVAADHPLWNRRYDNLLERASELCRHMSDNQIHHIWVDAASSRFIVRENNGKDRGFDSLSRADQDQVCLSVCLAVAKRMADAGTHIPMVFDDLFANLDETRSKATREVLYDFVIGGQQFILLANGKQMGDRYLSDRFNGAHGQMNAIFHLPDFQAKELTIQWPIVLLPGTQHKPLALPQPVLSTPVITTQKVAGIITEHTRLAELDLIDREALHSLSVNDVTIIAQLLDLDPDELPLGITTRGITLAKIDRWQSQAWLLCCVPGLRPYDVRLLVGSGISEPEMLEDLSAHDVLQRLETYLATSEGQRVMRSGTDYELARVNSWMRSLTENRSTWRRSDNRAGNSRDRRRRFNPANPRSYSDHDNNVAQVRNSLERITRDRDATNYDPSNTTRSVRIHTEREEDGRVVPATGSLTFYLNPADDLERAPSIGPKMAERFASFGVVTVEQFLAGDPESWNEQLGHSRINEKVISDWQHQARLVCRIPNLRGHDAQLLVACDLYDPESILRMTPNELFQAIVPFAETKEGQKILRSAKTPDMDEINDWISWAKNHRNLQVA